MRMRTSRNMRIGSKVIMIGVGIPSENKLTEIFETEVVVLFIVIEFIFEFLDTSSLEGQFLVEVLDLLVELFTLIVELILLFFLLQVVGVQSGAVGLELIKLFPEEGGFVGLDLKLVFQLLDMSVIPDGIDLKQSDILVEFVDLLLFGFELSLGLFDLLVESLNLVFELFFLVGGPFLHIGDSLFHLQDFD